MWISIAGLVLFLVALISLVWIVIKTLVWGDPVAGYPSLISVILLLGAVQLFSIGMIGQYVAKGYLEQKNYPIYLMRESNCLQDPGA